ncbi:unnamed protein product (macronuclear) [Paramecium tetraurelia]|uniref:Uncharacterized protein n=1 Tax=Paramecium tetraurelia TaxID=5888 RepID=A0C883_PARTE|nr:uncharacterized protein GSPATT00036131001 [Paramecium tetraurelia]CAK67000.1 unnamed protein product [Paramecium tetraurelia]|eukprot:XP_001434397.1 hypothetical protein (macronuclear) [Paramecium tetraurelia strain d4-2]
MSQFRFENKPSKQFPLDNKVWKLQEHPCINDEPLLIEESEVGYQIEIIRIFNDSRCQQYTESIIINNYTVQSVSQVFDNQLDSELCSENMNNKWDQYQFKQIP